MTENMADGTEDVNNSSILYELLVLSEWVEDYESVVSKSSLNIQKSASYFHPWKFFKSSVFENLRLLQTEYTWHLAVSKDGKVVAILQDTVLEIKTAKDEYSSIVGKAFIPSDQCPKLRKLSWSPDNSFLAVARDNGVIYVFNLFGCNVAMVEPDENKSGDLQPVAGLCFLQPKFQSTKWSNELLIVYHKGNVKSILLSSLDGHESEVNIVFSLSNHYPQGIFSVAYSCPLLFVAGCSTNDDYGLSVWRILNDSPYLKSALDGVTFGGSSRSFLKYLSAFSSKLNTKTIIKMMVSPDLKMLACLHFSGELSLWQLPAIVLHKKWSLQEQPEYNRHHLINTEQAKNDRFFHPVDIGWWNNNAVVIVRRNGALSVCSISDLSNLLGKAPEFLACSPQICCVEGSRSGVIALECEITCNYNKRSETDDINVNLETSVLQESIQAALYSFTDIERFEPKRKTPKIIQRTYRMIAVKRTTPEELYSRKIDNEEYEDALLLAQKYNLDSDLVYQKQWRSSDASILNIRNYLEKIHKILWVVNECVERVPEALEDAKKLLEFGLEKTNVKDSFDKQNAVDKKLITYRQQLLKFLDNLSIYEKIIGSPSKYNSLDYSNFRKQTAIAATLNFARQENWQAVSIMFTYKGEIVLPHWLPILSNFPETLKPLMYRSLLPEVADSEVIPWDTKKLRNLDWSEKEPFQSPFTAYNIVEDEILYGYIENLKEFQMNILTAEIVEEWYKRRAYEIEKRTGLVDHALCFIQLAKEKGIKSLNKLHADLLTLESLVYMVRNDDITLPKLERLNHFEQCKLLLANTNCKNFITNLKDLIVPFANRCKEQSCHSAYSLLRDILHYFGEKDLELPLELLRHLKAGHLNPLSTTLNETVSIVLDCVYSCPKPDQLENCFLILECLPQRFYGMAEDDEILHDRIDKFELHLDICEILGRYEISKSIKFIKENENNEDSGKELMQNMANYTKRETLDFKEFLSDCRTLQSKLFPCIPEIFCYELSVLAQMSCECEEIILSVEDFIQCRHGDKNKMLNFNKSVELVLQAARNHFQQATSFDDHALELARTCLRLINEPHAEICDELDLIEAIQLLGDFEVNMLPFQVRKSDERIKLIDTCLEAKPNNYKSCQRLLQLAQTLRIHGNDRLKREGEVLMRIAEHALKISDYRYCSEICSRLVTRNFSPAWVIVKKLAQNENFDNITFKKLFLSFAILHCPVENLEELIQKRITLHARSFGIK